MANMTNYYQAMPENLSEVIANAIDQVCILPFKSNEAPVIEKFQSLLWENDFIIAPRPKVTHTVKDLWFFGVYATPLEKILYPQLAEIDNRVLERNPVELFNEIGIIGETNVTEKAIYFKAKSSLEIYAFKVNF